MMDKAKPDTLFGVKAIAEHGGMSTRQAKYWASTGDLPTFKIQRTVCASRAAIDTWLAGLSAQARRSAA